MKLWLSVILAFLSGCASFSVGPNNSPCKPEEIWQAKAVRVDPDRTSETGKFSAVVIQAPESWVKNERNGVVSYGSNGVLIVNRDAWRAIAFFPNGSEMETSALLGSNNQLIVLFPGIDPGVARLARIFVFSGMGTFVLDSEGREYGGEKDFDACAFVEQVRHENVSKPKSSLVVADLSPKTQKGEIFLKALYSKFSEKKEFVGVTYLVASIPNIERATSGASSPDDSLFSNLSAFITPGMGVASAIEAVVLTGYGMATATPQGPYREAKLASQRDSDSSISIPEREGVGDQ